MLPIMVRSNNILKSEFGNIESISHLTGKKVKINNNKLTAIQEQLLCWNYSPSFEEFFILTRESNDFTPKIMESLLIAHDNSVLNKADSSLPLELFWYNISSLHVIWCPSIQLSVYNYRLFSFQYYITFSILSKTECQKLAINKWICQEKLWLFSWLVSECYRFSSATEEKAAILFILFEIAWVIKFIMHVVMLWK